MGSAARFRAEAISALPMRGAGEVQLVVEDLTHRQETEGYLVAAQPVDVLRRQQGIGPPSLGQSPGQFLELGRAVSLQPVQEPQIRAAAASLGGGLPAGATCRALHNHFRVCVDNFWQHASAFDGQLSMVSLRLVEGTALILRLQPLRHNTAGPPVHRSRL